MLNELPYHAVDTDVETRLRRSFRLTAQVAGTLTATIGCGHLVAWVAGVMAQRGFSAVTMKTNTSLCLLLVGVALTLVSSTSLQKSLVRWCARIIATLSLIISALTLTENLFALDFGIDQILARERPGALGMPSPNRMGTPASLSVLLGSLALLIFTRPSRRGLYLAQVMALVVTAVGLVTSVGYLYGSAIFYEVSRFTAIAWPTAVTLLFLGTGLLCAPFRGRVHGPSD